MRLAVVLLALAVMAVGCGEDDDQDAAGSPSATTFAELTVTVDHDGNGAAKPRTTRVRCDPASDSNECAALGDMKASAFAPTPPHTACTQQYGGPQVATVEGTLRGKPVNAKFSRTDGCEIARWNALAAVLGAAG
jgi:hypothetical protein